MRASPSLAAALVGFAMLWPASAHAADLEGDARWIDRLSGPGPFGALGASLVVACAVEPQRKPGQGQPSDPGETDVQRYVVRYLNDCSKPTRAIDVRGRVEVRGRYLWKLSGPRFTDPSAAAHVDGRGINGMMLDVLAKTRVHPMLDVGLGVGYIGLWGDGFEAQHRLVFIPLSAAVRPFAFTVRPDNRAELGFWQRGFSVKYELLAIAPPGYEGADFGNTDTAYSAKVDYVPSVGIAFDVRF
jgi:hypothetical protein